MAVLGRIESKLNAFRKMLLLCFYSFLVRPRPIIDKVVKCCFGGFALALQQSLVDSLSDLLT